MWGLLTMSCLLLAVLTAIALFIFLPNWKSVFGQQFDEKSSVEKYEAALVLEKENLRKAEMALESSDRYIRQILASVTSVQADINVINAQVERDIKAGNDDAAKVGLKNKNERVELLEEETKECEHAKAQHKKYADIIDEQRKTISKMQRKLEELKVKSALAQADENAAEINFSIKTGTSEISAATTELESQITHANASASAKRVLDKDKDYENEYLQQDLNRQLAELKDHLSQKDQQKT